MVGGWNWEGERLAEIDGRAAAAAAELGRRCRCGLLLLLICCRLERATGDGQWGLGGGDPATATVAREEGTNQAGQTRGREGEEEAGWGGCGCGCGC